MLKIGKFEISFGALFVVCGMVSNVAYAIAQAVIANANRE